VGELVSYDPSEALSGEKAEKLRKIPEYVKMLQKLPLKHQRLVQLTLANPGMSRKALIEAAGFSHKSSVEPLFKKIKGVLGKAFEEAGITQSDLIATTHDCLKAWKPVVRAIKKKNPATGKYEATGKYQVIEVPDYRVRRETVEMIYKLGGYFPSIKVETKGEQIHKHEFSVSEAVERLSKAHKGEIPAEYMVEDDGSVN